MHKAKHTPGPLIVKTDGGGFFWVDKHTKDGGFTVCNTGDGAEAEANANLYAAAPTLLDACKYTKTLLATGVGQHTHALALIEVAIAEAKKGSE